MYRCQLVHGVVDASGGTLLGRRVRRCGVFALTLLLALGAGTAIAAESDKKSEQPSQAELEQKLEAARKRLDEAARDVADLSMALSDNMIPDVGPLLGMRRQRAMLGINLGARRSGQGADGVEIVSVSPGGAAAEAGLTAGDVLIELKGMPLKGEDESPRAKLMDAMREVKPGDKVPVSYRRDGKVLKATLTAQPLTDRMFTMPLPPLEPGVMGPRGPRIAFRRAAGVFGSAELVALTPKLGQYFGTESGLLVVRAPNDSRLKLEDGDVIVDIDGRRPSSPSHALRILSSYQAGEKLKLNVLRARKRVSFEVTIPDQPWEKSFDGARMMEDTIEDTLLFEPAEPVEAVPPRPPGVPAAGVIAITTPLPEDPL